MKDLQGSKANISIFQKPMRNLNVEQIQKVIEQNKGIISHRPQLPLKKICKEQHEFEELEKQLAIELKHGEVRKERVPSLTQKSTLEILKDQVIQQRSRYGNLSIHPSQSEATQPPAAGSQGLTTPRNPDRRPESMTGSPQNDDAQLSECIRQLQEQKFSDLNSILDTIQVFQDKNQDLLNRRTVLIKYKNYCQGDASGVKPETIRKQQQYNGIIIGNIKNHLIHCQLQDIKKQKDISEKFLKSQTNLQPQLPATQNSIPTHAYQKTKYQQRLLTMENNRKSRLAPSLSSLSLRNPTLITMLKRDRYQRGTSLSDKKYLSTQLAHTCSVPDQPLNNMATTQQFNTLRTIINQDVLFNEQGGSFVRNLE